MNRKLVAIARRLRKNQTWHEQRLWQLLRAKRLNRYKFRRQYPLGKYVVDFCCLSKKLVIELDGGQHNERGIIRRDDARDRLLNKMGFQVLRFWNNGIDDNIEGVYQKIVAALVAPSPLRPPLQPRGRGAASPSRERQERKGFIFASPKGGGSGME